MGNHPEVTLVWQVLDRTACRDLATYQLGGGGKGLDAARRLGPAGTIGEIAASGLRGRGGGWFPTGTKWQTVAAARSATTPTTVIVNAAEGEPGTFKDHILLRRNPYKVLEGALIAAFAVGAERIIVGLKAISGREVRAVRRAIAEFDGAGWLGTVDVRVVLGPTSYLYGEETALLEVVEGRQPFPRVAPPYRRGVDPNDGGRTASDVDLAGPDTGSEEPPALVNNVETLANVVAILARGADWFRATGTVDSPGTVVCTVVGDTLRHGVGEVPTGTSLREVIDVIGGGPAHGSSILGVLSGVSNALIGRDALDTALTFDAMQAVGSGIGASGFIVFGDGVDPLAIAEGVSRFLAVESCGQCEPCKQDGQVIADKLDMLRRSQADEADVELLNHRLETVVTGARCYLAQQQQRVVGSILAQFPDVLAAHLSGAAPEGEPVVIAAVRDIVRGRAVLDEDQVRKQPDWSFDEVDSGSAPAARLGDTPVHIDLAAGVPTSPPPTPLVDPLAPIHEAHDRLRDLLDHVNDPLLVAGIPADDEHRRAGLVALARELRIQIDVNERVVFPMLDRVGNAAGAEAVDRSSADEDDALARLRRVAARLDNVEPDERELPDERDLAAMSDDIEAHIADDERLVVALLRDRLDDEQQQHLGDAMAEARASSLADR